MTFKDPKNYFNQIQQPEFFSESSLWNKSINFPLIKQQQKYKLNFYKLGKTFGFFIKRTLTIIKNYLIYYQNESTNSIKGICCLDNLYYGQFKSNQKYPYLIIITNFHDSTEIYLNDVASLQLFRQKTSKYTILLNFFCQYKIQKKIGQGSFSTVYQCHKILTKQKFAVKKIKKINKYGQNSKPVIQKQKFALSRIDSQYVIRLYQNYQDDNNFYIVLEYFQGKNLMQLINQNYPFNIYLKKQILRGILKGLLDLHTQNIIHRDLKPQNIMIHTATFKPKIIDLGLCLNVQKEKDYKFYRCCGTIGFIAPQILEYNEKTYNKNLLNNFPYDHKCDVFSFAIITYLLLFDRNPFKGKNYQEILLNNKQCKIQLDKNLIQKQFGRKGFKFLKGIFQKNPKQRISVNQALQHEFLKIKLKYNSLQNSKYNQHRNSTTIVVIQLQSDWQYLENVR